MRIFKILKQLFCNHSYTIKYLKEYVSENGSSWYSLNNVPIGLHVKHHTYKSETCYKCGHRRIIKLQ